MLCWRRVLRKSEIYSSLDSLQLKSDRTSAFTSDALGKPYQKAYSFAGRLVHSILSIRASSRPINRWRRLWPSQVRRCSITQASKCHRQSHHCHLIRIFKRSATILTKTASIRLVRCVTIAVVSLAIIGTTYRVAWAALLAVLEAGPGPTRTRSILLWRGHLTASPPSQLRVKLPWERAWCTVSQWLEQLKQWGWPHSSSQGCRTRTSIVFVKIWCWSRRWKMTKSLNSSAATIWRNYTRWIVSFPRRVIPRSLRWRGMKNN